MIFSAIVLVVFITLAFVPMVNNTSTNGIVTPMVTTPDCLKTSDKCLGYSSFTDKEKFGDIYTQVWLYEGPNAKHVFWVVEVSVNSENGAVLDGGYNVWSVYDIVGSHVTSTLTMKKADNGNQNIQCISPSNDKLSSKKAETVTFGIGASYDGASVGLSWQVSYPRFCQSQAHYTGNRVKWDFHDNQALSGSNPTSATYSGSAGVDAIHGGQSIDIDDSMTSLYSHWIYDTGHTYGCDITPITMGYISS